MNKLINVFENIYALIKENKDYLIELDAKFGDGDLGISMEKGFFSIIEYLKNNKESDLGKVFRNISSVFNENAPSSLGTIISFIFIGMAKELKSKEDMDIYVFAKSYEAGMNNLISKLGTKAGDKTILDSMIEVVNSMNNDIGEDKSTVEILENAYNAAKLGSENTKNMMAVHGRAAYHKEKTLGLIDGGSYVNKLVFEGIKNSFIE